MNDIQIEGISFNRDWVSSFTSVSMFITAVPSNLLEGEGREVKLTDVYNIAHPQAQVQEEKPKKK